MIAALTVSYNKGVKQWLGSPVTVSICSRIGSIETVFRRVMRLIFQKKT